MHEQKQGEEEWGGGRVGMGKRQNGKRWGGEEEVRRRWEGGGGKEEDVPLDLLPLYHWICYPCTIGSSNADVSVIHQNFQES